MQNDATPKSAPRLAEDCATMAELRAAIDLLDSQLVGLLAQRQTYIERAAVLKQDRAAVRDEARIEDVIAKVMAAAKATGLSSAIAEPLWRLLIERSIAHELKAFDAKG
jgi:isochorismate pyruvate lyase